jgi:DNA-binding NarL/FixJ family response regulator
VAASGGVPVVIMTRPDTADDLSAVLDAGAAGCLSVNLGAQDFLAALRMLAHGDMLVSHEMVPAVTSASAAEQRGLDVLTPRELDVLRALGHGATNQEIAGQLFVSPHTVKIHVRRVLAKMGFRNRQQAAAYAATAGLL